MTATRAQIERHIQESLGNDCSDDDARRLYDRLRAARQVQFDDHRGLYIIDGVDLLAEADAMLADPSALND